MNERDKGQNTDDSKVLAQKVKEFQDQSIRGSSGAWSRVGTNELTRYDAQKHIHVAIQDVPFVIVDEGSGD